MPAALALAVFAHQLPPGRDLRPVVDGVVATAVGKAFIGSNDALAAIFAQSQAGGAVLAPVAHAMILSGSDWFLGLKFDPVREIR